MAHENTEEHVRQHVREMVPSPDPTVLTTAALLREIAALEEKLNLKIEGVVSTFEARIGAIDRATVIFESGLNRVPSDVTKQVEHLRTLHDARFAGIDKQFAERDVRVEETTRTSKQAIDAALAAAKEAVAEQARSSALARDKSEAMQAKATESQAILLGQSTAATDSKIADIKERITRLEAISLGESKAQGTQHAGSTLLISGIAVVVAILSLLYAIISHLVKGP